MFLQFLNNVIITKTKVFPHQVSNNILVSVNYIMLDPLVFFLPNTLELFGLPIFFTLRVNPETCHAH